MGYLTNYSLRVIGQTDVDHEEQIGEASTYGSTYIFQEDCKWYDHEDDMRDYSKLYPELVFVLEGKGEDYDDIWIKYFKNGKMQSCYATISFEEFDETKLK